VLGAAQAMSLFAERQLIEIRIPSGKPGKDGSEALQRYCERLNRRRADAGAAAAPGRPADQGRLVQRAGRRRPVACAWNRSSARRCRPGWRSAWRARASVCRAAKPASTRWPSLPTAWKATCWPRTRSCRSWALLYPAGELSFEQVEAAVLNVARYDVFKLGEAILTGQVPRALRMLDGLRAEGEAAVLVHWTLAEDIRALRRARAALDGGRPLPLALKEARVWGLKEKLFERALPLLADHQLAHWLEAASVCDGLVKGLRHPGWPADPGTACALVLMMLEPLRAGLPPAARLARAEAGGPSLGTQ
jgi:DNA polymerase-3 subunit delta